MIVLGNREFALGMRLAGIRQSHVVEDGTKAEELFSSIPKKEVVVANASVVGIMPELSELENLIVIPDEAEQFGSVEDLKKVVKSAIGFEIRC